jgi:hypothetical protein
MTDLTRERAALDCIKRNPGFAQHGGICAAKDEPAGQSKIAVQAPASGET